MKYLFFYLLLIFPTLGISQGSLTALSFDGVDDRITGTNTGLNTVTNNFTMEMWVSPTATITFRTETNAIGNTEGTSAQRYVVFPTHGGGACPATAGDAGIGISVGTNGIQVFEHKACQMPALLVYNTALPTGWSHIAVVFTAKQPRLYLNGVLVRTGVTSNMTNVFPSAQIGTTIYGNYAGDVDEFRIWNTSRSQAQIRDNMCLRLTGAEANLIRYYRFDEGAGTTLTDASSSSVNGTLTSGPTWGVSSAAIGNTSTHVYRGANWTGVNLIHSSPELDSLEVNTISNNNIRAIHIYHVNNVPVNTTGITGLGGNDHYFGVYKARLTGSGDTYTAVYYYKENDAYIASSTLADPDYTENGLRVFTRSNNSTASWTMNATAPNTSRKSITLTAQSTEFILAFGNSLANLPVELISFNGYLKNKKVELYWQTLSEINNQYFAVERSVDGINFEEISRVAGAGNSNSPIEYKTMDENPLGEISYYRLRQVDFDGTEFYSNIISVKNENDIEFEIYPNPSNGEFYLNLSNLENELVRIDISDITGRVVHSSNKFCENKNDFFMIDLRSKIAVGTYLINAHYQNHVISRKIIIE